MSWPSRRSAVLHSASMSAPRDDKNEIIPGRPARAAKNNGVASSSGRRCSTSAPHSNSVRATATEPLSAAACNAVVFLAVARTNSTGRRRRRPRPSLVEQTIHRVFIARATRPDERVRGHLCVPLVHEVHQRAKGTRGVAKRRHCREIVVGGFGIVRVRMRRRPSPRRVRGGGSVFDRVAARAITRAASSTTSVRIGSLGGFLGVVVPGVEIEDDVGDASSRRLPTAWCIRSARAR